MDSRGGYTKPYRKSYNDNPEEQKYREKIEVDQSQQQRVVRDGDIVFKDKDLQKRQVEEVSTSKPTGGFT